MKLMVQLDMILELGVIHPTSLYIFSNGLQFWEKNV